MSKIKKTKNQVIVVPTTQKTTRKTKPTNLLTKSRSLVHKENTLAYYNCLLQQIANPANDKIKITQLCHNCKHNKGKVKAAQQECKGKLIKDVARNYLAFGQSLGHYLQTDLMGQVKQLKK